jgi:tetratricopeptide (TPR) repeat protein
MADLPSTLAVLERDPDDAEALDAVRAAARAAPVEARAQLAIARKALGDRGRPDLQAALIDVELALDLAVDRRADLLLEQGMLLDSELLDARGARRAFEAARALRPDDSMAREALEELEVAASNWRKFADKYVREASASTDRSLATGLFVSAAEAVVRFAPSPAVPGEGAAREAAAGAGAADAAGDTGEAGEAERYLRKALEIDPRTAKAAFHLARLLRASGRWEDLAQLLEARAEHGTTPEERVSALLGVAGVARAHLGGGAARAEGALRRVLAIDPAQPQAMRQLAEQLGAARDWAAVVAMYQAALRVRRDHEDVQTLLRLGAVLWHELGDLDQAEDCYRRVRKLEPAHPEALDFYRAYYPAKGEPQKLLALLRQVEKAPRSRSDSVRPIGMEIAELAEAQNNPEKAIEAWKQHLRADPAGESAHAARAALARLYRRTEKWNALLDLMKEELERVPEADVAARVAKLHEVVEIYRDKLRLDVMVINTYNAILKIDPDNRRAADELAAKYRALGRWNDLIAVLTRKVDTDAGLAPEARVQILREIATLWAERFGNHANAIRPLERILELAPADGDALARLKEIYTKRRQWRALVDVLAREAAALPAAERRAKQLEMARLAADRLGDPRLAIEIYNGILADRAPSGAPGELGAGAPPPEHTDALAALASLYDREKRWLALAEILHRQAAAAAAEAAPGSGPARPKDAVALLERLGPVYADRLGSPQAAAEVWQQVLDLEPGHARALRTLRELYATAGDFRGLERLYARLGQEEELVDALLGIADRLETKAQRLPLVERAAQLAQQRADAAAGAAAAAPPPSAAPTAPAAPSTSGPATGPLGAGGRARGRRGAAEESPADQALERARQVWERVLAVDPHHPGAALALAPIYARQEKWAKLITVLEIELAVAVTAEARLAKIAEIRQLCEHRLASRTLAFAWTLRAFELDPASAALFGDALRLASEPEQWRDLVAAFEAHAGDAALDRDVRLRLYRELARIAVRRLGDPERARAYHRSVLALAPDDREAEQLLEELAIQLADWPELLASYRRRAARERDATERASLLIEIASLQEEKLVDLDGAAATYHEALQTLPGQLRALRALARIEEARGDWDSLVGVLAVELQSTEAPAARFDLLMRLGTLEEQQLERMSTALAYFRDALAIPAATGGARPTALAAIARYLPATGPGGRVDPRERVAAARLVAPHLEAAAAAGRDDAERRAAHAHHALALEVVRAGAATSAAERLDLDRRLARLYHRDLGDPAAAWTAGLRVIAADPADADARVALGALAGQLGRDGEWAGHLAAALAALRAPTREDSADDRGGAPPGARGAPAAIRAVATELARLAGDRLGERATAERAWLAVLDIEPDAVDALDALAASYRAEARWQDLRALLERRAHVTRDDGDRRGALLELAALEQDVIGAPERAIAAHRRVLELEPGYAPSYVALDHLLAANEQWRDLEALLAQRSAHVAPRERAGLAYRRAALAARALGEPARAIDLIEEVIAADRAHVEARALLEEVMPTPAVTLRAARLLEPLYEQDKQWRALVAVLRVQRRLAAGTEAVELLARIAAIEEAELAGGRAAFDAWLEVLGLDPTHERARLELVRLAQALGRWPEATAALEAAAVAAPPTDVATRAALLGELAAYFDGELRDPPRAIGAYRRLLELDGGASATARRAAAALARLYEQSAAWPELRAVARRQAEWADGSGERRALLGRVAGLEEHQLGDREAAIRTWRDVLDDQPQDRDALDALERLYTGTERWRDLIDVLRRKLDHTADGAAARGLLARIAEIHEVMLEDPDEAIAAHLEIVDREPADRAALAELARLYRAGARHADLLDVLERQALGEPASRVAIETEIAQLLGGPLARPTEALDRWAAVLAVEPLHPQAHAAVSAALEDAELRLQAASILRPVYAATAQYARLAALQLRASEWADDPAVKLRALAEVVVLRERHLGDPAGAFAAQLLALHHAATEPELPSVVAETERLAGDLGREADLIDAYRAVAPSVLDAEIQRRLYLDVADLARAVRRDLALAREYYEKVLLAQPDDPRALAALEGIHRETGDAEALTDVLLRQADAATADVDDRVAALVEAAGLYAQLRRPEDAIATWEQVLAVAPERRDAVQALEQLYRAQGRWPDVVDLYERRLGFATSVEEAVGLRVQLGEIHERQLRDFETAIDNFSAALSGDPRNATALAAVERYLADPDLRVVAAEVLEPIYVAQHRWKDLIRVWEARLASTADPRDRLRLTRYIARLYEEQLEDFEHACFWYAKVFREAPSDPAVRDQLQRLASIVDNWDFVAETYQGFLDDDAGDPADQRDVAIATAAIYDRRLADTDRAYDAYRRALAIQIDDAIPNERELIRRLEELLGRSQRWPDLVAIYDDVVARADDDLRREALIKRARLLEGGVRDAARAIAAWRDVVDHVASAAAAAGAEASPAAAAHGEAMTELERLYRAGQSWRELVELLEGRVADALARGTRPAELAELRLRLADALEVHIGDLASAIDQYELVIAEGPAWERAVSALERLVVSPEHRERIAELLEPVYREQDWWQKLVVILDAKLEYVRDPVDQIGALHEIARIHEERGGALELALAALARAWRIDVADDDSLAKLLGLATRLRAWDEVVRTLEEGAAAAPHGDLAGDLWARAAEIHEHQRGDLPRAIAAWRRVQEARPDDMVPLSALDRLLARTSRISELVVVIARRAELTDDPGVQLVLLHRVAALYEESLRDPAAAIAAYRSVLGVDDADLEALDALERLYRARDADGDARELVAVLERKIELIGAPPVRRELRRAAAQVYEQALGDHFQAIDHLSALLADEPGDVDALAELDRIYTRERMWPDLLDVVDRRALLAIAARERADLAARAAALVEHELADPEAAIPRYGGALEILPAHDAARVALERLLAGRDEAHVEAVAAILERLYRGQPAAGTGPDAAGLIRVYERRLAVGIGDRRADWAALAAVHEDLAGAPREAFAVWGRALAAAPDEVELLEPLLRLAAREGLWAALADRLDALLRAPLPPDVDQRYAMQLGEIARDHLGDRDRAARAFDRAAQGPGASAALAALAGVLAADGKWRELAAVRRRQADSAEHDATSADHLAQLGDLSEVRLDDPAGAVAAYREAVALVPAHPGARAALERMLRTAEPRELATVVEVLEPLFEHDGDDVRVAAVVEARLRITDDAAERAALLQRLVELHEQRLGDAPSALAAALRWLAVEPGQPQPLHDAQRLAERTGAWSELAERIDAIARAPGSEHREPEAQVALLAAQAGIQRLHLRQPAAAAATYRAALAIEPGALAVLDELIAILREEPALAAAREPGGDGALAAALLQRGRAITEVPEKRAALAEVAALRERGGDRAGAVAAWRELLELDDADRDALGELARIYRADLPAAAPDLVDVLGQAARVAASADEEKLLRVEIATLEADGPRAVPAWQAVLDLDPGDLGALGALERAYARGRDWIAVADVQARRLALASSTAERVAIHGEMARLAERERGSADDAIASWYAALDLDPAHAPATAELERLLAAGERWHDLVELLTERVAAAAAARGDRGAELGALARAADLWEGPLGDPEAAGELLEQILARDPTSVAALTRLSKIYERAGDWERCAATLNRALQLQPAGRDAADLFFRLGEVARVGGALGPGAEPDLDTAIQHLRQALKHDPLHPGAIAALEQLARERRDAALLADMLERRVGLVAAPAERVALLVELAELARGAGRVDAALAALARAAADAPTDARVLTPLADLYFAAGQLDQAAPIYDRLAEDARAGRRMKEVARFRQRQGSILEARGDRAGALAAYEEALRVNPSDVTTMTGLGRLYFAAQEWEKARRIYQSLVLQSFDAGIGVTKGEVYWTLGTIHLQLGQPPKARSMFQRGLEVEPDNARLRAALAQLG